LYNIAVKKSLGKAKMSLEKLNKALKTGENICTEFKRCGGKIERAIE
jgi:hypothetical protein